MVMIDFRRTKGSSAIYPQLFHMLFNSSRKIAAITVNIVIADFKNMSKNYFNVESLSKKIAPENNRLDGLNI